MTPAPRPSPRFPRPCAAITIACAALAGAGGGPDPSTTTTPTNPDDTTATRTTPDEPPPGAPATGTPDGEQTPDVEVLDDQGTLDSASRWEPLLADAGTCPGQRRTDLPVDELARSAACLVNHARTERGLRALARDAQLEASAGAKVRLLARCDEFTHTPCNQRLVRTFRDAGYGVGCTRWRVGENLAVGSATLGGSPREVVLGWLRSSSHRTNLLDPEWLHQGMAVLRLARWEPVVGTQRRRYDQALIWADQFGTRTGCP